MAKETGRVSPRSPTRFSNGTTLRCGFAAAATHWTDGPAAGLRAGRLPAEQDVAPGFRSALGEVGLVEQETIHLDAAPPAPSAGVRGARGGVPAADDTIVLRPAPIGRGRRVPVVLYQDESGGLSWHFPDGFLEGDRTSAPGSGQQRAVRPSAEAEAVFTIPGRSSAARSALRGAPPPSQLRGPITKWGRKVLKVLGVPILAPLLEKPLESIVAAVERKHRQDLVRALTPDDYRRRVTDPFTGWPALDGQRALLVIHGIFSSTEGMLAQLPRPALEELHARYGGRVLALDQLTVSKGPEENARFFLDAARALPGGRLRFDVLCHSRGGIVARTLAERGRQLAPDLDCGFDRVFFVATPNRGSLLADPDHVVDMLDVFTNLLTAFPDGPVTYSIEVLLAIVKLLAHAAETGLPGLAAMGTGPETYIRRLLNASVEKSPAAYAAAAADYEPDPKADNGFLVARFADAVVDRIFVEKGRAIDNDLVVPTESVFGPNGHRSFPIADPLVFRPSDAVYHTAFFGRTETLDRIRGHFGIGGVPTVESATAEPAGWRSGPVPVVRDRRRVRPAPGAPGRPRPPRGPADGAAQALRKPFIDFHEMVHEGQSNDLRVRLEDLPAAARATLGGVLALDLAGKSEVELRVTLSAPGFDVEPGPEARLVVRQPRDASTEAVTFTLVARPPGPEPADREIRADFWIGATSIGAVTHRTVVTPKGYAGPLRWDGRAFAEDVSVAPQARESCEFQIVVEGEDESGAPPLRVRLTSLMSGDEYTSKAAGVLRLPQGGTDLTAYLKSAVQGDLDKCPRREECATAQEFRDALEEWEDAFADTLDALGRKLWDLLPEGLRTEYLRLRTAGRLPRSILVHSDEMVFPWELVYPYENGRALTPLGQAHVLGRWRPGRVMKPQPQRFPVRRFCVLNPSYPPPSTLPWAAREADALQKLFPKLTVVKPADRRTVKTKVLDRDDTQILHFSGHGEYDAGNGDLSRLHLEGGDALTALLVTGSPLAAGQPIVYLNACSVGSLGVAVGRPAGFAATLLDGGVSGVIAPYWPINDQRAMEFSLSLYGKLKAGRAIGEALQELRTERPRDTTVRAFSYFGDPWTRANFAAIG